MLSLVGFKSVSACLIWMLAMGGGLFPIYCMQPGGLLNSCLNMLTGGVFLASSFVHLLPDAMRNVPLASLGCKVDDNDLTLKDKCFPFAFFFYGIGFLTILLLEVVAHAVKDHLLRRSLSEELIPLTVNISNQRKRDQECRDAEVTHAHMHDIMDRSDESKGIIAFAVFFALSFHSLMEGIGIGAAPEYAWNILLAIIAHKSLAGMALTMELLHHKVTVRRIVYSLLVFACMSPIGVFTGYILAGSNPSESVGSGICTALAGGTFLYVGAMEILPQELQNKSHLGLKLACFVSAFILFSALALWI
ncbi:Zinc (Zn2)-Iron (Fe2) Permease (ZIP) Family [Thraustotheca clavata]|uniref:Zinc (Zn2)-Iron (Fe2) Permease (ZIP) Family n=1 Tax=Thraustotheca clavata TaxID=74557 RepID=A0A1W0ABC6_9STRA|nr:Zinc (Zn2)-Iron (Fe2) Permease (ZIP) Family [Thraustotheca clavata]